MTADRDLLECAYEDCVKEVFKAFFGAMSSGTDSDVALQHFKTGIDLCRRARDLAINNLPAANEKSV